VAAAKIDRRITGTILFISQINNAPGMINPSVGSISCSIGKAADKRSSRAQFNFNHATLHHFAFLLGPPPKKEKKKKKQKKICNLLFARKERRSYS